MSNLANDDADKLKRAARAEECGRIAGAIEGAPVWQPAGMSDVEARWYEKGYQAAVGLHAQIARSSHHVSADTEWEMAEVDRLTLMVTYLKRRLAEDEQRYAALRTKLAAVAALHHGDHDPTDSMWRGKPICDACGDYYPCPTVAAIADIPGGRA